MRARHRKTADSRPRLPDLEKIVVEEDAGGPLRTVAKLASFQPSARSVIFSSFKICPTLPTLVVPPPFGVRAFVQLEFLRLHLEMHVTQHRNLVCFLNQKTVWDHKDVLAPAETN